MSNFIPTNGSLQNAECSSLSEMPVNSPYDINGTAVYNNYYGVDPNCFNNLACEHIKTFEDNIALSQLLKDILADREEYTENSNGNTFLVNNRGIRTRAFDGIILSKRIIKFDPWFRRESVVALEILRASKSHILYLPIGDITPQGLYGLLCRNQLLCSNLKLSHIKIGQALANEISHCKMLDPWNVEYFFGWVNTSTEPKYVWGPPGQRTVQNNFDITATNALFKTDKVALPEALHCGELRAIIEGFSVLKNNQTRALLFLIHHYAMIVTLLRDNGYSITRALALIGNENICRMVSQSLLSPFPQWGNGPLLITTDVRKVNKALFNSKDQIIFFADTDKLNINWAEETIVRLCELLSGEAHGRMALQDNGTLDTREIPFRAYPAVISNRAHHIIPTAFFPIELTTDNTGIDVLRFLTPTPESYVFNFCKYVEAHWKELVLSIKDILFNNMAKKDKNEMKSDCATALSILGGIIPILEGFYSENGLDLKTLIDSDKDLYSEIEDYFVQLCNSEYIEGTEGWFIDTLVKQVINQKLFVFPTKLTDNRLRVDGLPLQSVVFFDNQWVYVQRPILEKIVMEMDTSLNITIELEKWRSLGFLCKTATNSSTFTSKVMVQFSDGVSARLTCYKFAIDKFEQTGNATIFRGGEQHV